jgi:protein phosphatase
MRPATPTIHASVLTDPGCVREINEDRVILVRPADAPVVAAKGVLVLVADGMGGHLAGEVASDLAASTIHRTYYDAARDVPQALREAFLEANRQIFERASGSPHLQGMGTTCTALVLRGWEACWGHVGDSRLYLVRDGRIYQFTEDHSAVAKLVATGQISRDEARHHEERNVILRALGTHPDVEVDVSAHAIDLRAGDRFVLATDGLCDTVSDDELLDAVTATPVAGAAEALVGLARTRGGHDNITVAIVELADGEAVAEAEPRETGVGAAPQRT